MSLDAVRLYVAVVAGAPDADDDALIETMVRCGCDRDAAARVNAMVPLAFGRLLLDRLGVALSASYLDRGAELPLAGDHAFAAALSIAGQCDPQRVRDIGLRSAELAAVDKALHAGSDPTDLVLSPPAMSLPPAAPPRPIFGVQATFDELIRNHGVGDTDVRFEAELYPRKIAADGAQLQLDLRVSGGPLGPRVLIESVGGWDADLAGAIRGAVQKLAAASLHPILATLVAEPLGADQVHWERWGDWRVCFGPLIQQWARVEGLDFGAFLDHLRDRLLARGLLPEIHWVRVYLAMRAGEVMASEVLLDNDVWPDGQAALAAWPWPRRDGMYSLRSFFVMRPA
jgi:hypothetical protein